MTLLPDYLAALRDLAHGGEAPPLGKPYQPAGIEVRHLPGQHDQGSHGNRFRRPSGSTARRGSRQDRSERELVRRGRERLRGVTPPPRVRISSRLDVEDPERDEFLRAFFEGESVEDAMAGVTPEDLEEWRNEWLDEFPEQERDDVPDPYLAGWHREWETAPWRMPDSEADDLDPRSLAPPGVSQADWDATMAALRAEASDAATRQEETAAARAAAETPQERSRRRAQERNSALRASYDDYVQREHERAEAATRGAMLSAEGRRLGISSLSLFYGKLPRKYASEELLAYWGDENASLAQNGNARLTFGQWKRAHTQGRYQRFEKGLQVLLEQEAHALMLAGVKAATRRTTTRRRVWREAEVVRDSRGRFARIGSNVSLADGEQGTVSRVNGDGTVDVRTVDGQTRRGVPSGDLTVQEGNPQPRTGERGRTTGADTDDVDATSAPQAAASAPPVEDTPAAPEPPAGAAAGQDEPLPDSGPLPGPSPLDVLPTPLPRDTPTARPVLYTYQRRNIVALGLDNDPDSDVREAARRIRARQPLTQGQAAALATRMRALATEEGVRPVRQRAMLRAAAAVDAANVRLGGTPGDVPTLEGHGAAVPTALRDLTAGDWAALPAEGGGIIVGRLAAVTPVMGGRLLALDVEGPDGTTRRLLDPSTDGYLLPDLPPPPPEPGRYRDESAEQDTWLIVNPDGTGRFEYGNGSSPEDVAAEDLPRIYASSAWDWQPAAEPVPDLPGDPLDDETRGRLADRAALIGEALGREQQRLFENYAINTSNGRGREDALGYLDAIRRQGAPGGRMANEPERELLQAAGVSDATTRDALLPVIRAARARARDRALDRIVAAVQDAQPLPGEPDETAAIGRLSALFSRANDETYSMEPGPLGEPENMGDLALVVARAAEQIETTPEAAAQWRHTPPTDREREAGRKAASKRAVEAKRALIRHVRDRLTEQGLMGDPAAAAEWLRENRYSDPAISGVDRGFQQSVFETAAPGVPPARYEHHAETAYGLSSWHHSVVQGLTDELAGAAAKRGAAGGRVEKVLAAHEKATRLSGKPPAGRWYGRSEAEEFDEAYERLHGEVHTYLALGGDTLPARLPEEDLAPDVDLTTGTLEEKIDRIAGALGDPALVGRRRRRRYAYADVDPEALAAGRVPPMVVEEDTEFDADEDKGPGSRALRHLYLVTAAGRLIHEEGSSADVSAALAEVTGGRDVEEYRAETETLDTAAMERLIEVQDPLTKREEAERTRIGAERGEDYDALVFLSIGMRKGDPGADVPQAEQDAAAALRREITAAADEVLQRDPDYVEQVAEVERRRDEWRQARREKERRQAALLAAERSGWRMALERVRGMGRTDVAYVPLEQGSSSQEHYDLVSGALDAYPTEWLAASTGRPAITVVTEKERGYYSSVARTIGMDGTGPRARAVAIHEWGHHMEVTVPGLTEMERVLYWKRSATGAVGARILEEIRSFQKDVGGGYTADEVYRGDKWKERYTGKDYSLGRDGTGSKHWEIFTTGIESLFAESEYVGDDEHRDFVLGALAVLNRTPTPTATV